MQHTISIIISGKVQGVFFRQSAKEKSLALGINGRISNLPDGTVHIIATGTKEQLDELTGWCKQGPPTAKVTTTAIKELPLQLFDHFSIERF